MIPEQIRQEIRENHGNPENFLYESLLWRGFLALRDARGHLCLYRGSHPTDTATLSEQGAAIEILEDNCHSARISAGEIPVAELAERILCLPAKNSMTWPFPGGMGEESFFNCRFGEKLPTEHLDPGVALMVKVLNACGLRTVMSCQGHPGRGPLWPEIFFHSEFDLKWAVMIFKGLHKHPEFAQLMWKVGEERSTDWCRFKIIFCPPTTPATFFGNEYDDILKHLQMAARKLLLPQIHTRIQEAKQSTKSFETLPEALQQHLEKG